MAKKKFSIEQAFEELDAIVAKLEDPDLPLSDALDQYKKGVKLLDQCNQTLDKTEKEMIILQEGSNGTVHERADQGEDETD